MGSITPAYPLNPEISERVQIPQIEDRIPPLSIDLTPHKNW